METTKPTIVTTTSSFGQLSFDPVRRLEEAGYEVAINPYGRSLSEDEMVDYLSENEPIGILAGTSPLSRVVLEAAGDDLEVVSRVGVGWDNVDHDTAQRLDIHVERTPDVLTDAVAEFTIGLMISALRLIVFHDRQLREGVWEKVRGRSLKGKTLGVIGFGSIGQRVAEHADHFGADVVYFDKRDIQIQGAKQVGLDDLLETSDLITIHASGSEEILGPEEFSQLGRDEVVIMNLARGGMIDENALRKELDDGSVGYACLDVFGEEPYDGPLKQNDRTTLTPHIASSAREARIAMEEQAVENLLEHL